MFKYSRNTSAAPAQPNLPRRRMLVSSGMIAAGLLFGGGSAFAAGGRTSSVASLSEREKADLLYMREEEKLARDVYLAMYQIWRLPVFSTIASSEQQHMDAMLSMVMIYGLTDPVASNAVGKFTDPRLQTLHDQLVARGKASALEALRVGGYIEEVDMLDIQHAMDATAASNLDRVYASLMSGSRNHLQAFANQIKSRTGQTYVAQVLTQAEVLGIIGY